MKYPTLNLVKWIIYIGFIALTLNGVITETHTGQFLIPKLLLIIRQFSHCQVILNVHAQAMIISLGKVF